MYNKMARTYCISMWTPMHELNFPANYPKVSQLGN